MSFWKRLLGKREPASQERGAQTADAESGDHRPTCPFCTGCEALSVSLGPCGYPVWRCPCGSIGSGAWAPDLDEVADQLLEILGIGERVSQPMTPTDHPAISLQRYDAKKAERDFHELIRAHGFEFRTSKLETQGHGIIVFWVKHECSAG